MDNQSFERFQLLCENVEFRILEHGIFEGSNWNYNDLQSPFNRLYILLEGEATVNTSSEQIKLRPGYCYIIPKNTNFSCSASMDMKKIYFHFSFEMFPGKDMFEDKNKIIADKNTHITGEEMVNLIQNNSCKEMLKVHSEVYHLISDFIEEENFLNIDYWDYAKKNKELYQMIKNNLTAELKVSSIARAVNMTPQALSKSFKKHTGEALKTYIQKKLMHQAKILLLTSHKSIKEIAFELKYDDALYFSKVFKKWEEVSPKEYRKLYRI